jgi:hypothetical protein
MAWICLPQMFSMNKYIGAHIEPYKPVDLNSSSAAPKKRKAKSSLKEKPDGKKKAGTQAPYRLSDALVAVVGKPVLPRPQVTQALWAYIRENRLQVGGSSFFSIICLPSVFMLIDPPPSIRSNFAESAGQARNHLRQKPEHGHGGAI